MTAGSGNRTHIFRMEGSQNLGYQGRCVTATWAKSEHVLALPTRASLPQCQNRRSSTLSTPELVVLLR